MEFLNLEDIEKQFNKLKDTHLIKKTKYNTLLNKQIEYQEEEIDIEEENELLEQCILLLTETTKHIKGTVIQELENLVTTGLQFIFEEELIFKIDEDNMKFIIEHCGYELNPKECMGGGVVDIISVLLKFALLQSFYPKLSGPFLLDEVAKMVSREYIPKLSEFLQQINRQFSRQIIMCSHNQALINLADNIYLVNKKDDISYVKKILLSEINNDIINI